eukprot:g2892.t1
MDKKTVILSPLSIIDELLVHECSKNTSLKNTNAFSDKVSNHFCKLFTDNPELISDIPLIDNSWVPGRVPPNSLVRYVGMVQDVLEPEFYGSIYNAVDERTGEKTFVSARYREYLPLNSTLTVDVDNPVQLSERFPVFLVPVPGANTSAKNDVSAIQVDNSGPCPTNRKRGNSEMEVTEQHCARVSGKRLCKIQQTSCKVTEKKVNVKANKNDISPVFSSGIWTTTRDGPACIVKVPGPPESAFRLNTVVEVVGILAVSPETTHFVENQSAEQMSTTNLRNEEGLVSPSSTNQIIDFNEEEKCAIPPGSMVPRIHSLTYRVLGPTTDKESLGVSKCWPRTVTASPNDAAEIGRLRAESLSFFTRYLGGDALSAEFLLMHAASVCASSAAWIPFAMDQGFLKDENSTKELKHASIGSFPLCLAIPLDKGDSASVEKAPEAFALEGLMKCTLDKCVVLPLTRDILSSSNTEQQQDISKQKGNEKEGESKTKEKTRIPHVIRFDPFKDFQSGRIVPGRLQLSPGTNLVVDETSLTVGPLDSVAVCNLGSIRRLIEEQTLELDFQWHKQTLPMDVPTLVICRGRPIIPSDSLCLIHMSTAAAAALKNVTVSDIENDPALCIVKKYLATVKLSQLKAYFQSSSMTESTPAFVKCVEETFVHRRKLNPNVGPSDCHRWLAMTRLLAATYAKLDSPLDEVMWEKAIQLDDAREKRKIAKQRKENVIKAM